MESVLLTLVSLLAVVTIALFYCSFYLWRRVRALGAVVKEKEMAIEKTAVMLMGKNMELIDQNTKQQKLLELKEDFVGIVSHQLRTPATEIKWGIDELRKDSSIHFSADQITQINLLYKSSEWMVRLIDNLMHLVGVQQGFGNRTLITPFDVDTLINVTAGRVAGDFKGKEIKLTLNLDFKGVVSSIDSDSLIMVVQNIIENAFQYTPMHGVIVVESHREPDSSLKVSVKDSGMGISPEKQKTIFVKFQRSKDAMAVNSGGMGLGLYIVKNIVGQYKGTIGFVSKEGEGSTFFFTLPGKEEIAKNTK